MKRTTILLLTAAMAIGMSGAAPHEHQVATMQVEYIFSMPISTTDTVKHRTDDMMLQIAPSESRFFSLKTEWYDSIMAQPGGSEMMTKISGEILKQGGGIRVGEDGRLYVGNVDAFSKIPSRGQRTNVFKYHDKNKMTVFDYLHSYSDNYFTWDLPLDEIEWLSGDSVATILGYECQNATADYHGRRWTAWYAPDIPVSEGPWQFSGLPGLILRAESCDGEYIFSATAIHECEVQIHDMYGDLPIEKCDRKEFRRLEDDIARNPGKYHIVILDGSGDIALKIYHDLIETDYKDPK